MPWIKTIPFFQCSRMFHEGYAFAFNRICNDEFGFISNRFQIQECSIEFAEIMTVESDYMPTETPDL